MGPAAQLWREPSGQQSEFLLRYLHPIFMQGDCPIGCRYIILTARFRHKKTALLSPMNTTIAGDTANWTGPIPVAVGKSLVPCPLCGGGSPASSSCCVFRESSNAAAGASAPCGGPAETRLSSRSQQTRAKLLPQSSSQYWTITVLVMRRLAWTCIWKVVGGVQNACKRCRKPAHRKSARKPSISIRIISCPRSNPLGSI